MSTVERFTAAIDSLLCAAGLAVGPRPREPKHQRDGRETHASTLWDQITRQLSDAVTAEPVGEPMVFQAQLVTVRTFGTLDADNVARFTVGRAGRDGVGPRSHRRHLLWRSQRQPIPSTTGATMRRGRVRLCRRLIEILVAGLLTWSDSGGHRVWVPRGVQS